MGQTRFDDMAAFLAVADERSFTRAAAKLGMSPSALSHLVKGLESKLGLRLLARTTRSVAPTQAGEALLETIRPALASITAELSRLGGLRDRLAGSVRITTFKYAAASVIWPALPAFAAAYPDVKLEVTVDEGLTDIVAARYDAGIRFGEQLAKDMVAVRVGPDLRAAVVATPEYFARHPAPKTPQELDRHRCLNYRLATSGGLLPWEFERGGRRLQVRVEGPLICNDGDLITAAVLAGQGIGYTLEAQVAVHLAAGRLVRVLEAWSPLFPGCYLYYPSRRQATPALAAFVEVLRARAAQA